MFCGSIYWVLLVSGRVSVPKPLSQIQRSTRWLLQGLSPRTSFGGFGLSQRLVAHSAVVATAALMVVIVVGGFWFDNRLSGIEAEKEALAGQLRRVAEDEAEMKERLRDQGYLTYFASAPEVSTRQLSATGFSAGALGMVLASPPETRVVLVALDLPVLSADQIYRAWLVKEDQWYEAGSFTVDSTGFVQIGLELPEPLSEYQAIVITIGKAGASAGPLEQSVLEGDL